MIKNIIFDWGGVCTSGHLLKDFSLNFSEQAGKDAFEIEKVFRQLDYPYETGKIAPEIFWRDFSKTLGLKNFDDAIKVFFNSYKINADVLGHVKDLRQKYQTILFSNNYADLFAHMILFYRLGEYFDQWFSSSGLKFKKPEKEAYESLIASAQIKPEETIFVDDKEKNLLPAKELGFKTIVFTDIEQLKTELIALAIL